MLIYYNSQNQPVKLLKEIGRGGEGVVFTCEDETLVGKIYHQPISDEKAEKLLWMVKHKTKQLLKTTAWVAEVLKDTTDGKVVGFLMPKIKAKEIHELYAPKSRRVFFPDATWHFLVHTATNLARAFHNLHKDGHVMGDVNQGNCVVTTDGTVKLIDCDSYGIKTENKTYPCEVGVITHIPPELQGKNLRNIRRTENHDNFGLAIVIFQLLFLGRHPFSGNYLGKEDKPLEDAIREHLFAYGKDAEKRNVAQPPGTPPLSAASFAVAELFERAFSIENNRPQPHEWVKELEFLADNLQQCLLNPGHVFYSKLTLCPWCEIEEETGLILFPFTISNNALTKKYERTFDIATIEKLIENFGISSLNKSASEFFKKPEANPSQLFINEKENLNRRILRSVIISSIFIIICVFAPIGSFPTLIFFMIILSVLFLQDHSKETRQHERETLFELKTEHEYFQSVFSKSIKADETQEQISLLKEKLIQYSRLKSKTTNLSENSVNIGEELNPVNNQLSLIQSDISSLLIRLRAASVKIRKEKQKFYSQIQTHLKKLAQAEANVEYFGREIPYPYIILFGSLFISLFLPSFYTPQKQSTTIHSVSSNSISDNPPPVIPDETISLPPTTITDKEIAQLSYTDRNQIVKQLIDKAYPTIDLQNTQEAQKHLNFALRFDKYNARVMSLLGRALYNSGKYKEALQQFEEAKKFGPEMIDDFYLGMTYLNLKKYSEARDIFHKLTSQNISSEGLYNLGQAYMGLKDYKSAAQVFGMAVKMSPEDVESLYQLGICFSKLNDKQAVKDTYESLKAMNSPRAEEFRKTVGKSLNLPDSTDTQNPTGVFKIEGTNSGDEDEPPPPIIRK